MRGWTGGDDCPLLFLVNDAPMVMGNCYTMTGLTRNALCPVASRTARWQGAWGGEEGVSVTPSPEPYTVLIRVLGLALDATLDSDGNHQVQGYVARRGTMPLTNEGPGPVE